MAILPMTPVLFSRAMTRVGGDGVVVPCSISFGTPALNPNPLPPITVQYYCPFQLTGFQDDNIYYRYGEDALEAVIFALSSAGSLLGATLYANKLNEWDASTNFGFPIMPTFEITPDGNVVRTDNLPR